MECTLQYKVHMKKLWIVTSAEWLMVLPATILLSAAALRLLQPREHEPSRTL